MANSRKKDELETLREKAIELVRLRRTLIQELRDIETEEENQEDKEKEDVEDNTSYENLNNVAIKTQTIIQIQEFALERLMLGATVQDNIGKPESDIDKNILHMLKQEREILRKWREKETALEELKEEVALKKNDSIVLQRVARNNYKKLEAMKSSQKKDETLEQPTPRLERMKEQINRNVNMLGVVMHILQGLVLGSKINWTEDPRWSKAIMEDFSILKTMRIQ